MSSSSSLKDEIISGRMLLVLVAPTVSPPSLCAGCNGGKMAVYTARVCRQRSIQNMNPQPYDVPLCLKCLPLNAKKIRAKVSDSVEFQARRAHTHNKYSRLIDALDHQTEKVTNDEFLFDLRQRIVDLGMSLNQHELQEAWRKLNS
jgi:hypothetical protein